MAMELGKYGTELQAESDFQFQFVDADCECLPFFSCVLTPKVIEGCFEAKSALLQLALLLVAHGHIVEKLKSNKLVSFTPRKIDHIENAVCFLQQEKCVIKLISTQIRHRTLIQLAQHHGYFVYYKMGLDLTN